MRGVLKWLLAPVVVVAGLTFVGTESAEAHRWRAYYHYPGYHYGYAYRYGYGAYYNPGYYWGAPAVRVQVYRPPVVYPGYVAAPCVPYYWGW